jgi:hypothetical protein
MKGYEIGRNITVEFTTPDGRVIKHGACIMSDEQLRAQYRPLSPSDQPKWPCRGETK